MTPTRPPSPRLLVSVVTAVVAGALLTLASAAPATAHAVLIGTDPADGAVLPDAPSTISLDFDEPVSLPAQGVVVLDGSGDPVDGRASATDATVTVALPDALPDGTYVVSWRVVSADGHPVAGALTFSVGAPGAAASAPGAVDPPGTVARARQAVEALASLGLLGCGGLVVFELLLLVAAPPGSARRRRRLGILGRWAAGLAVGALVVGVPVHGAWQRGQGLVAVADGAVWQQGASGGRGLAVLLGCTGVVLAQAMRGRAAVVGRPGPAVLAFAGVGMALGSLLLTGHTRGVGPGWLVLGADALHVLAGAVWLGGVVGMSLVLARSSDLDDHAAARTLSRFSAIGAGLLLALATTGLLLGWRVLGGPGALPTTAYGRVLLVKAGLAVLAAGLAGWNHWALLPRYATAVRRADGGTEAGRRRLRRTVTGEAALLVAVVAATGVLVTADPTAGRDSPPSEPSPTREPAGRIVERPLGEGALRARLTPGGVGVNALELEVLGPQGDPVDPLEAPTLRSSLPDVGIGPLTGVLVRTGPGRYEATVDLPLAGRWELEVAVRTSTYDSARTLLEVEVS